MRRNPTCLDPTRERASLVPVGRGSQNEQDEQDETNARVARRANGRRGNLPGASQSFRFRTQYPLGVSTGSP
jgi:hypothetical protein